MMKKRKALVLEKLAEESGELASMVAELSAKLGIPRDRDLPMRWSRRFAASGKDGAAPRIRRS